MADFTEDKKIDNVVAVLETGYYPKNLLEVIRDKGERAITGPKHAWSLLDQDKYLFGKHDIALEILKENESVFSKKFIEFLEDAYEINRALNPLFVYNSAEYFKNPSTENLAKIKPEFGRVMDIRNQRNVLRVEVFNKFIYSKNENGHKIWEINFPTAMYNLESQVKAYSEAVDLNKDYNKSIEDILLKEIILSIPPYSIHPDFLGPEPDRRFEVIALGCGSGIHEYEFVLDLAKQRQIPEDRIALTLTDINQAMVEEAVANIGHRNLQRIHEGKKPLHSTGIKLDFLDKDKFMSMDSNIIKGSRKLYLFLGSTLGNFDSFDQKKILENLCCSMYNHFNSHLIIGVKGMHYKNGKPDRTKMEKEYLLTENFAYKTLEILGIKRDCLGDYKAHFNAEERLDNSAGVPRITCSFPVIKEIEVTGEGETCKLDKGDIIRVIQSQRFTVDKLNELAYLNGGYENCALNPFKILEKEGYIVGLYHRETIERMEWLSKVRNEG
jgi:hypothetical protein